MGLTMKLELTGSLDDITIELRELAEKLDPTTPPNFVLPEIPDTVQGSVPLAIVPNTPATTAAQTPATIVPVSSPAAPTLAAVAAPVAVDLDALGLPWDDRICAKNKGKNTDGTWRSKRNINKTSPGLIAAVHAELRAAGYAEPVTATPTATMAAAGNADLATATTGNALGDAIDLATQIVTKATSPDVWGRLNGVMAEHGLPQGVQSLVQFPDKIPAVHMALQQLAKELGVG